MKRYSLEILHWLLSQGVKAVVIACNTSTAHALRTLQEATPVPVLGVIKPGAVPPWPPETVGRSVSSALPAP